MEKCGLCFNELAKKNLSYGTVKLCHQCYIALKNVIENVNNSNCRQCVISLGALYYGKPVSMNDVINCNTCYNRVKNMT